MEQAPFMANLHGHVPWFQFDLVLNLTSIGLSTDDLFSFAFMRDPVSRFVSAFEYAKIQGAIRQEETVDDVLYVMDNTEPMRVVLGDLDGQQGTVRGLPSGPLFDGILFNLFMPQAYFLIDTEMKVGPKFIGRFENVKTDWNHVCDTIGADRFKLPHLKKVDKKSKLTKKNIKSIERFYEMDYTILDE